MMRAVVLAFGAIAIGFICGKTYADASPDLVTVVTPGVSIVAAFHALGICRGDRPVSSTIEPIVELGI